MRRGSPAQVGMRAALAAPGPPAQADPLLLTGDWRSRCPASPSSARGSCAAGSMPGTDRGSRFPARIRAGSSTRTRKERSAFLHHEGFPPLAPRSALAQRDPDAAPLRPRAEPRGCCCPRRVRGCSGRTGRTRSPGCLFKFGEVGPTPSKGAWGFGVNPCQASP